MIFCTHHVSQLARGDALLACRKSLLQYLRITRSAAPRLTPDAAANIGGPLLSLREAAGVAWIQTTHMMLHLVVDKQRCGKPLQYGDVVRRGVPISRNDVLEGCIDAVQHVHSAADCLIHFCSQLLYHVCHLMSQQLLKRCEVCWGDHVCSLSLFFGTT